MNEQKKEKTGFLFHNSVMKVVSLVLAFCVWVIVAVSIKDEIPKVFEGIPVTINQQSAVLTQQGLTLISTDASVATVTVSGPRYAVGGIDPAKDIVVSVSLATVTGAGDYASLRVDVKPADGTEFTVTDWSPKTVQARFDKLSERTFTVTADAANYTVANGFVMRDAQPQASPREVTITGPEEELARVARAVVAVDMEKAELSAKTRVTSPIQLYDKDDQLIEEHDLKLDYDTAELTFNVLKTKEVPIRIEYTGVPNNFPIGSLKYTLSSETVRVAGPTDKIDSLSEIVAGYVSLSDVTLDSSYQFDIQLPTGFENLDNVQSVQVEFDTAGMVEKSFYVSDLRVRNAPAEYSVSVITKQLPSVTVVGPADVVNALTGEDIIAEVDLSDRQITTGQMKLPASVQVPSKGLVWATGTYSVVVDVKEK